VCPPNCNLLVHRCQCWIWTNLSSDGDGRDVRWDCSLRRRSECWEKELNSFRSCSAICWRPLQPVCNALTGWLIQCRVQASTYTHTTKKCPAHLTSGMILLHLPTSNVLINVHCSDAQLHKNIMCWRHDDLKEERIWCCHQSNWTIVSTGSWDNIVQASGAGWHSDAIYTILHDPLTFAYATVQHSTSWGKACSWYLKNPTMLQTCPPSFQLIFQILPEATLHQLLPESRF
jgi:hypothetical protein